MSETQQDPYEKYDFSDWDELPSVSCWCPTFARESLLEEALESFLQQDYPGKKELVIVNGNPDQTLVFDHPEVRIYNAKERFLTLGAKQKFTMEKCEYEFVAPWGSDDIHLSSRLSRSFERMRRCGPILHIPNDPKNFHYYAPNWWILCEITKGENDEIVMSWHYAQGYDHGATVFSQQAVSDAGVIGEEVKSCRCSILEEKYKVLGYWSWDGDHEPGELFYIYRRFLEHEKWLNITSAQRAGMEEKQKELTSRTIESTNAGRDWLAKYARKGVIELNPHWKTDYVELSHAYRGEIRLGDMW